MTLVQQNLPIDSVETAENLFAGMLLDYVPVKRQPQNLLDNLLNRHRQLHRRTGFCFIFSKSLGSHVLDDFVSQVFEASLLHPSSMSSSRRSSSSSFSFAILRKASGRCMTRFLMSSGTFLASTSSSFTSASSAFPNSRIRSSEG